jgi:hypothetical protein
LHFAHSANEISFDSGNIAVLQCVLDGDSSDGGSFSWTGPAVTNDRAVKTLDSSGTVSTLTIASVGRRDEGQYSCSFTGLDTISITLDVVCKLSAIYRSRVPFTDSHSMLFDIISAVDPHFLPGVPENRYQEFIEETDVVVECPAFLGDPQGTMIWLRDSMVISRMINDDQFIPEDGRLTILNIREGDEGVYRCAISLLGIRDSRYITINVLERDTLAPRIVEPSNPIQVMYGDPLDLTCQLEVQRDDVQYTWTVDTNYEDDHFKNTTPALHRDAYRFLGGRYTCKAVNEYGYDEQVFHVRILGKSVHTSNKLNDIICGKLLLLLQLHQCLQIALKGSRQEMKVTLLCWSTVDSHHRYSSQSWTFSGVYRMGMENGHGSHLVDVLV